MTKKTQQKESLAETPRYLIQKGVTLSFNAMNVLESAFSKKYDNHPSYANAYNLYDGHKGMDWWNFPWDLGSSHPEYTITYDDMRDLLMAVRVKINANDSVYVKYSIKLTDMVQQMTPLVMNAHGGYLRVIKIIYCVRNFLDVAIRYNLTEDINNLIVAAQHLLSINKNRLDDDPNKPNYYGRSSKFLPKTFDGYSEDRTRDNGLENLRKLVRSSF